MVNKINSVLKEVLVKIKPSKKEIQNIEKHIKDFTRKLDSNAKKLKINAESFVGGSFAKGTAIKKNYYDADVFVRFDKKYKDNEISDLTEKILRKFTKNIKKIHGSRDYFSIRINSKFFIEVIPVINIKNPKEARNVTDLSYSHVKYINKKAKGKMNDEILLAKAFCHANKCYGAESYIKGFSGYSLELLICYYKSFLNMIRVFAKDSITPQGCTPKNIQKNIFTRGKLIIDIEKNYKNKNMIMMDVNNSKLKSPIILIDPTFKQRNAAASLSEETFERFKEACRKFLKNPSEKAFEEQKKDFEKIKQNALKNKNEFVLLEAKTEKQEGDIAGSKLMKFYNHLCEEISRSFDIKDKEFNYNNEKSAKYYLVVRKKKEIILQGPMIIQKENVVKFKKAHRNTFVKHGRIYAKQKINFSLKQFIENWKKKNEKKIREMSVRGLKVVD